MDLTRRKGYETEVPWAERRIWSGDTGQCGQDGNREMKNRGDGSDSKNVHPEGRERATYRVSS